MTAVAHLRALAAMAERNPSRRASLAWWAEQPADVTVVHVWRGDAYEMRVRPLSAMELDRAAKGWT